MRNTFAGVGVDPETALTYSAIYSAVKIISETIASLPLITYRRAPDGGKIRIDEHPISPVLARRPNSWQTHFEFIEMMQGHVLLRGNAYAQVLTANGRVSELIPLHPARIEPRMESSGPVYQYTKPDGDIVIFPAEEIFHLRGLSSNGLHGLSPIAAARESIGLGMAAQEHGARLFGQGARPAGVLTHPGKLDQPTSDRIRQSWERAYGGLSNAHSVAVLEEGMQFERVQLTSEDSQWIESRKFQIEEIARFYRIPLHKMNSMERATFSNIESQAIEFVSDTIIPWVRRWEETILRDVFTLTRDRAVFAEFLIGELLRGDTESRYKSYAIAKQNGWMNSNEIRALENMNPIDEQGDIYWAPVNMTNAEMLIDPPEPDEDDGPQEGDGEAPEVEPDADPRSLELSLEVATESFKPIFYDSMRRCIRKEALAVQKATRKREVGKYLEEFYQKHGEHIERELKSTILGFVRAVEHVVEEKDQFKPENSEKIAGLALKRFIKEHIQVSQDVIREHLLRGEGDSTLSDLNLLANDWENEENIRFQAEKLMNLAGNLTKNGDKNDSEARN